MTIPGSLLFAMMVISVLSYGFSASSFAQISCGPDEVIVKNECVPAFDDDTSTGGPFSVETDQPSYDGDDIIRISGMIKTLNENYQVPVTIILVDSTGNIVAIAQVMPDSSGAYSHSITAGGTMKTSGDYEIRVQYGAQKYQLHFHLQL